MKGKIAVMLLFWFTALYDGLLGLVFLFAPSLPFERFGVTPPNHMGYVQFPAALLIVFALMFVAVALRPVANRNFILPGIGLKVSYSGIVFLYWLGRGIPAMWKPFAVADLVFLVLFVWAWLWLRKQAKI